MKQPDPLERIVVKMVGGSDRPMPEGPLWPGGPPGQKGFQAPRPEDPPGSFAILACFVPF